MRLQATCVPSDSGSNKVVGGYIPSDSGSDKVIGSCVALGGPCNVRSLL
jgi:hypothetical protein